MKIKCATHKLELKHLDDCQIRLRFMAREQSSHQCGHKKLKCSKIFQEFKYPFVLLQWSEIFILITRSCCFNVR